MQIDELLPSSARSVYPVVQPDDPYIADLLQLADGRSVLSSPSASFCMLTVLSVFFVLFHLTSQ